MKKAYALGAFFFSLVVTIGLVVTAAQDFSRYEGLKEPRLTTLPSQEMLVVEAKDRKEYMTIIRYQVKKK